MGQSESSSNEKTQIDSDLNVRTIVKKVYQESSDTVTKVMLSSWKPQTCKHYDSAIRKWQRFCDRQEIDPFEPNVTKALDFLGELFDNGLSYSSINSARSALSSFLYVNNVPIGQHPMIVRFVTGVFNLKPPLPRCVAMWDVDVVLKYFRQEGHPNSLLIPQLSHRLAMLLALSTGRRGQVLHMLDIDHMRLRHNSVTFYLTVPTKTYRKGTVNGKDLQQKIKVKSYPANEKLCPVTTLNVYLHRLKDKRTSSKLLVSTRKPHDQVSRATISHWLVKVMAAAGIDTAVYKSHSTRSAAVSKAFNRGASVTDILESAGWNSTCCFAKYYLKDIEDSFQAAVLD